MQKWGPSMTWYSIFQEQPGSWIFTWNPLISYVSNKLKDLCTTLGQLSRTSIDSLCLLARFSLLAMSLLPPLQKERKCKQQHRDVKTLIGHNPSVQSATNKHCIRDVCQKKTEEETLQDKKKVKDCKKNHLLNKITGTGAQNPLEKPKQLSHLKSVGMCATPPTHTHTVLQVRLKPIWLGTQSSSYKQAQTEY